MRNHSKNYLVTGGAGFLGLHIANDLHQRGNGVVSIDIADHDPKEYPGIECHTSDIRSPDFKKFLKGIDVVIHAAAALPSRKKEDIYSINVLGTRNVLENCIRESIQRVVFISSTGVYGLSEKNPTEEKDPLVGIGPYGETKIAAEEICREYRKKGLCIPILRAKPIVGIGRLGAFQILFDWIQSGKRIPIIGNGKNRYQLLHVGDLLEAISLVSEVEFPLVNTEFNVGAKNFGTVAQDVGALCNFADSGSNVLKTPAWLIQKTLRFLEIMRLSPFYQWFYESASKDSFVSTEKIEKLGWQAKKNNSDCLIEAYQWYLKNIDEQKEIGHTHRTAWRQGILRLAKVFF